MTRARILVVEDDRVVARDIQTKLRRIGHEVAGYTARGDEAVEIARQAKTDLVLMDIRIEGPLDGVEAARQIRDLCGLPVVFLTAYADDETVRRASITEPFGYLMKPFDDLQLRTVVEMAIYKHGAERRLRDSERRYAATLSSIGDAVIATDERALITFLNPSAERLTGWSQNEAVNRPVQEVFRIVDEVTRVMVDDPVAKILTLGVTIDLADQTILLARDGRELPIDHCGSPIIGDGETLTGAVLVFRDMTERRKVEENLRRAQQELAHVGRVSAIGELTISIAHEMNQPLMSITTNAAACVAWLSGNTPDLPEAIRAAQGVITDGHRAGAVISSIRALARKSDPTISTLDLSNVILDVLSLLQSEWRRLSIRTEIQLSGTSSKIRGDRVQLQQLVLNLVMNAMDALTVCDQASRQLRVTSEDDHSGFIEVKVSDSGVGLDPSSEAKIFDSFFTTKPGGIGMGLSICRSIVEAHGGRLWFSRNPVAGSCFHFTIPKFKEGPNR